MKTASLLKQLGLHCAVHDCTERAVDVMPISINNAPKKNLPVCSRHADAAVNDMWANREKKPKKAKPAPDTLRIRMDGHEQDVPRKDYVTAKTKQMQEFGYPSVTEDGINEQIEALFAKNKLTVIGWFMKDEIVLPPT